MINGTIHGQRSGIHTPCTGHVCLTESQCSRCPHLALRKAGLITTNFRYQCDIAPIVSEPTNRPSSFGGSACNFRVKLISSIPVIGSARREGGLTGPAHKVMSAHGWLTVATPLMPTQQQRGGYCC